MKWTPGPWKVGFSDGSGTTYITGADEKVVVSGCSDSWGIEQGVTDKHNAQLVAAAPELYAALQLMVDACNKRHFDMEALYQANRAMLKARGEQ